MHMMGFGGAHCREYARIAHEPVRLDDLEEACAGERDGPTESRRADRSLSARDEHGERWFRQRVFARGP